jgi:hypothetical protein
MNSTKTTLYLIASILAFTLLSANVSAPVFATGGLDDEEEEEAIEELQTAVEEIKGTLGTIELNLTTGSNDITANCPSTEEIVQEVVENITQNNDNVTTTVTPPEQPAVTECPVVPEEPVQQNETTVIPEPVQNETVAPQPVQNVTEPVGCQPIPEPEPEQNNETQQSVLEPIICPVNGEILGYTNTTSGEQLPISAVNETIPFLPPIELPVEPEQGAEQNQTVVTPVEPEVPPQQCNNITQVEEPIQNETTTITAPTIQDEQEIATIEFEASCGCFVVDKSPEEVGIGNPEEIEQGLYY